MLDARYPTSNIQHLTSNLILRQKHSRVLGVNVNVCSLGKIQSLVIFEAQINEHILAFARGGVVTLAIEPAGLIRVILAGKLGVPLR